ncbi:SDR family oxidoreductase [bacterium]|nr:SDR family oxidoreductase [bacterium]
MINKDKKYLVMGLLDANSIAYAIGEKIKSFGAEVVYTVQNEKLKQYFFDRSENLSDTQKNSVNIEFCDVTDKNEVKNLFDKIGQINGLVHSIAYANPMTCLGDVFRCDVVEDIKKSFHISCLSLATAASYAQPNMADGGSIVTLTFDSRHAYGFYNWMGINKSALEALVRALARNYGKNQIRVNAVSAGPVFTQAASHIPGFSQLCAQWAQICPIPWDPKTDKGEIANLCAFLLGEFSKKITGQTIFVDGGASVIGGRMFDHEKAE